MHAHRIEARKARHIVDSQVASPRRFQAESQGKVNRVAALPGSSARHARDYDGRLAGSRAVQHYLCILLADETNRGSRAVVVRRS